VALDFAATEKLVFLATVAVRAFHAAHQQNRYTQSHKDGHHSRIRYEPVNYAMHKPRVPT